MISRLPALPRMRYAHLRMPITRPLLLIPLTAALLQARSRTLDAWPGAAPTLDGVLSPGEWDDATRFTGVLDWTHTFSPTSDPHDLALIAYVKHDGKRLYFAFDVTDDILYGIDTPRWLPPENPKAHELTPQGYPWFGDEMELLINATNKWTGTRKRGRQRSILADGLQFQQIAARRHRQRRTA